MYSGGGQEIKNALRIPHHLPGDSSQSQPSAPLIGRQPICPSIGVTDKPQTLLSVCQPVCPSVSPSIVSLTPCPHYAAGADTEGEAKVTVSASAADKLMQGHARGHTHAHTCRHINTDQQFHSCPLFTAGKVGEKMNV